ncbi:MAG: type II toxin-antitoxin system CcdA family antitoxin [candidate division WOR-3 bacterium]
MGKRIVTSIRIDEDVFREAKDLGLNVSKIAENALKEAIKRLKWEYLQTEPKTNSDNDIWCGRRDLNPGCRRGGTALQQPSQELVQA